MSNGSKILIVAVIAFFVAGVPFLGAFLSAAVATLTTGIYLQARHLWNWKWTLSMALGYFAFMISIITPIVSIAPDDHVTKPAVTIEQPEPKPAKAEPANDNSRAKEILDKLEGYAEPMAAAIALCDADWIETLIAEQQAFVDEYTTLKVTDTALIERGIIQANVFSTYGELINELCVV